MFVVRYRAKDGSSKLLELNVSCKSEVFKELQKLGISAISITTKDTKNLKLKTRSALYTYSVLVVAIIVFCITQFFQKSKVPLDHNVRKDKQLRHEDFQRNHTKPHRKYIASKAKTITAKVVKPSIQNPDIFLTPRVTGRIVTWKHRSQPVFTNQFESFVSSVLTAIPGERFLDIELSDDFDESFYASLTNKIVITKDDTDEVVAMKMAVIESKEEVRKMVAQGLRPRDVVTEARNELNKIADYRDNLQSEFEKYLITESDPEEVLCFAQAANQLLSEYGAMPLDAPDDIPSAQEALINVKENKIIEQIENTKENVL